MKTITTYQCEICISIYDIKKKAEDCEAQKMDKKRCAVGDVVYLMAGYGWFDGDKRWVINIENKNKKPNPKHGNCFGKCCTLAFYYVITAITLDPDHPHKWKYHAFTNAMTGKKGHREGYTFVGTHYDPKKIKKVPDFVIKDSKKLIGKKTERLL